MKYSNSNPFAYIDGSAIVYMGGNPQGTTLNGESPITNTVDLVAIRLSLSMLIKGPQPQETWHVSSGCGPFININ